MFHDDTLDRVTDASGKIEDYTYIEISKIKVFGNATAGFYDKIPALREFVEKFSSYNIHFAIELKVGDSILASDVVHKPKLYAASIEAEDIPSAGCEILSDDDTSGGKYIRFNNTVNITNIAGYDLYMSFSVKCSKRSSNYVWIRVYATDNGSDSVGQRLTWEIINRFIITVRILNGAGR